MELKITKERVLEAAKDCADAKRVLTKLFPEVFVADYVQVDASLSIKTKDGYNAITRRNGGHYVGAPYLGAAFDWAIIKDNEGMSVLVGKLKQT